MLDTKTVHCLSDKIGKLGILKACGHYHICTNWHKHHTDVSTIHSFPSQSHNKTLASLLLNVMYDCKAPDTVQY